MIENYILCYIKNENFNLHEYIFEKKIRIEEITLTKNNFKDILNEYKNINFKNNFFIQ